MPVVKIDWFEGRTKEVKVKVAAEIEKLMVTEVGCPPGSTYVIFNDVKRENWAIEGKLRD